MPIIEVRTSFETLNDFIELTQFNAAQESSKHLSKVASVDQVSTISLNVKSTPYLDNVDN